MISIDPNRLAQAIRGHALRMVHAAGASHIASCLSAADILAVLYGKVLRVDPARPDWPDRDRFVLSKGHAAAALYAVLAETGFFPPDWLDTYCRDGSPLAGHATAVVPGVEVSTGSLGHGLPIACGMALAAKRNKLPWRAFALLSDGECDEGSVWEAALFAPHHRLDNLSVRGRLQQVPGPRPGQGSARPGTDDGQVGSLWLGRARSRWPRSGRAGETAGRRAVRAGPAERDRGSHRQGQGSELHGERADLALSHAQRSAIAGSPFASGMPDMRTAFINGVCDLAERDPRVWIVTGDLGFSVLEKFQQQFPDRFVNAGVAEQNMTGLAAGLALSGCVVFTYSIANFSTLRCLEQIRNDVGYHHANVKVISVGGGYTYASLGYSHHGLEDLAILSSLPEMVVVAPGDPHEARLAAEAVVRHDGPCYVRLGKAGEPVIHSEPPQFEIGRAIRVREGDDATLISTGGMLKAAVDAHETLLAEGVRTRVLSMHTVKPLDEAAVLEAASQTGAIVTLEEHNCHGGLGSAVADVLALGGAGVPFAKVAAPDRHVHVAGSQAFFRAMAGDPVALVHRLLERQTAARALRPARRKGLAA